MSDNNEPAAPQAGAPGDEDPYTYDDGSGGITEPGPGDMNLDEGKESGSSNTDGESGQGEGQAQDKAAGKKTVIFSEEQQEVFDREIGEKTGQIRALERKVARFEQQIAEINGGSEDDGIGERPDVPEYPDRNQMSQEEFDQAIKERDKAIEDRATWDAASRAREELALEKEQQETTARAEAIKTQMETYLANAEKLGVTPEELKAAGQKIFQEPIPGPVSAFLLDHALGPQIVVHLSENPQDMTALLDMAGKNMMNAGVHIATVLADKVRGTGDKTASVTGTPEPHETLSGSGNDVDSGPPGVKYE